jgi:hypothetical protein
MNYGAAGDLGLALRCHCPVENSGSAGLGYLAHVVALEISRCIGFCRSPTARLEPLRQSD